jgi:hypothetical protein
MSQPEGIYLSADYAVTNRVTQDMIDPQASKLLQISFPPEADGPRALLAFTGLAELPNGTKMMDWIRSTMRGEVEYIDQAMQHLLTRLNRDIARYRAALYVNVLVIEPRRRLFGGFSNVVCDPKGQPRTQHRFGYQMHELHEPYVFANGGVVLHKQAQAQIQRLIQQLGITPNKPRDYMNLMAIVNRKIAARSATVSPYCRVSYLPAEDFKFGVMSEVFADRTEPELAEMPLLTSGMDMTDWTRRFLQRTMPFIEGDVDEPDYEGLFDGLDFDRRP